MSDGYRSFYIKVSLKYQFGDNLHKETDEM